MIFKTFIMEEPLEKKNGKMPSHPLFSKYELEEKDLKSLDYLYGTKIGMGYPRYNSGLRTIELEVGFKTDHEGGIYLFDRLMMDKYGGSKSCGLARHFVFETEEDYYAFMNDMASIVLMGYYAMVFLRKKANTTHISGNLKDTE